MKNSSIHYLILILTLCALLCVSVFPSVANEDDSTTLTLDTTTEPITSPLDTTSSPTSDSTSEEQTSELLITSDAEETTTPLATQDTTSEPITSQDTTTVPITTQETTTAPITTTVETTTTSPPVITGTPVSDTAYPLSTSAKDEDITNGTQSIESTTPTPSTQPNSSTTSSQTTQIDTTTGQDFAKKDDENQSNLKGIATCIIITFIFFAIVLIFSYRNKK